MSNIVFFVNFNYVRVILGTLTIDLLVRLILRELIDRVITVYNARKYEYSLDIDIDKLQ